MDDRLEAGLAAEAFERARIRQIFRGPMRFLRPGRSGLLPLAQVTRWLRPTRETYRGVRSIPLHLVVGSEERHRDFDRAFLPKRRELSARWTRLYRAFVSGIALPPIKVYELGGLFFVRDGNHRVSVAREQRREFIDAEVVRLDSEISLSPEMGLDDIKRVLADKERAELMAAVGVSALEKGCCLRVTEPGGYDRIRRSIEEHGAGSDSGAAFSSWCREVCMPVQRLERRHRLTAAAAGSTVGDLLTWILRRRRLPSPRRSGEGAPQPPCRP